MHAKHLLPNLKEHYIVTTYRKGNIYAGIDLHWDYKKHTCRLSTEGYIQGLLKKYDHPLPSKPQHAPHKHCEITYGSKQQLVPDNETPPAFNISGIRRVQGIVGELL